MVPFLYFNEEKVQNFLKEFWDFYKELLVYKKMSKEKQLVQAEILRQEFDRIFSQTTGYDELDARIALSDARENER